MEASFRPQDDMANGLPLLTEAQRHQLLVEWNDTAVGFPRDKCIQQLFEEQVEADPDSVAVVFGDRHLSYDELNARSNRLGRHLRGLGVEPDTLVAICVERSLEMVVGLLGILKAGGAYVPLDPQYPAERLSYVLVDTAAAVVLTQERLVERLPAGSAPWVCLDRDWDDIARQPGANLQHVTRPDHLAYCLYTSGSTGNPKGVGTEHQNVVRLVKGANYARLTREEVFLQAAPLAFDASTFEVWGSLLNGARLVVMSPGGLSLEELAQTIERHRVSTLWLTAVLFERFCDSQLSSLQSVRQLLAGGDVLPVHTIRRVLAECPSCRLINGYGPTESTTFALCYPFPSDFDRRHGPIGRPISNTQVYLLDKELNPVPVGVPGELYLAGLGLARGYVNRPDLTAEKFIPNPFAEPGKRMYRTGDLGCYLADGNVEFLGRTDHQVKIRGFRIELGEIEHTLLRHHAVREAAVIAREDDAGKNRLVAYVAGKPESSVTIDVLRTYLRSCLPEYMIPDAWMLMDALPLHASGKLDRAALPVPEISRAALGVYVAPRTPVEEMLVHIWTDVLRVDRIGVHDGFRNLGGSSMQAMDVISRVGKFLGSGKRAPQLLGNVTIAEYAVELAKVTGAESSPSAPGQEHSERNERLEPVSFGQEQIWFLEQLGEAWWAYRFHASFRFQGDLKRELLERAINRLVERHEILRTRFVSVGDHLMREVLPSVEISLPFSDLSALTDADRSNEFSRLLREELQRQFDVSRPPLVSWLLIRLSTDEHVLLQSEHHYVHDGQSFRIAVRDLGELYSSLVENRLASLPEIEAHFSDYCRDEQSWVRSADFTRQLGEWVQYLKPVIPEDAQLFQERRNHREYRYFGAQMRSGIDGEALRRIAKAAASLGVSRYAFMLGVFGLCCSLMSGRDRLLVGSGLANRTSSVYRWAMGMFVNMVPILLEVNPQTTYADYVRVVGDGVDFALRHSGIPIAEMAKCLAWTQHFRGEMPLGVAFSFHDSLEMSPHFSGLEVLIEEGLANGSAKLDLNVICMLGNKSASSPLEMVFEYNTDMFDAPMIARMVRYFRALLDAVIANPQAKLKDLSPMTEAQRHQLLVEWNDTAVGFPRDKCIQQLFEEQVEADPDSVAVVFGDRHLSYDELNARSNRLGRHLRGLGVEPDTLVAICVERSLEMVVGLLGILKAGGAYVPLDPQYPAERLSYVLVDTAAAVVLTQERLVERLPAGSAPWVCLDRDWDDIARQPGANLQHVTRPDHLAYCLYTSGSTGNPKGVGTEHQNVVRLVKGANYARLTREEVFLQAAPLAFDASTFEVWGSLLNGARLVVMSPGGLSLEELAQTIERHRVSTLWLTAVLFERFCDSQLSSLQSVRQLLAGGDVLPVHTIRRVLAECPSCRLINGYGPTESTTFALCYPFPSDFDRRHGPIGRPISNTQVYLLDKELNPVPVGVPGELYLAGLGLARGYVNRPDLTAEKFIPNPFAEPGKRMYRTGDLGCYLADGNVEFLGRTDHQVKIRGFRIELGEIEARLTCHAQVREAVALVREDSPGEKRLVAYVIPQDPNAAPSAEHLRSHLLRVLPEYMVPGAFVMLEQFPLTPSGKLDRKALPPPDVGAYVSRQYEPPQGEVEEILARIWQELLQVERVGRYDNFFELGGHSLLIVRLMERLRLVGLSAEVRRVFESPTLADLASTIVGGSSERVVVPPNLIPAGCERIIPQMLPLVQLEPEHIARIVQAVPGGAGNIQDIYPLAPLQQGILFQYLLNERSGDVYVTRTLLSVASRERLEELIAALQGVIGRHDILRTALHWEQLPQAVQVVYRHATLPVQEITLEVGRNASEQLNRVEWHGLDLRQAPLMRLQITADPAGGKWYAVLLTHHLTVDNQSSGILFSELAAYLEGGAASLPEPVQYRSHVAQVLAHAHMHDAQAFFCGKLGDVDEPTAPFGLLDVYGDGSETSEAREALADELAGRIRVQARSLGVSAATMFHAAWGLVIGCISGRDDVVFGTVLLGRLQGSAGAQRILGMFINTLPLRLKMKELTARELVERTHRELGELLIHENASLAAAQRCSQVTGSTPLFTTLLNYRHGLASSRTGWSRLSGIDLMDIQGRSNYPILCSIDEVGESFFLELTVDRRIDPRRMIALLSAALQVLVQALEDEPQALALKLPILPQGESRQVIEVFNPTEAVYPQEELVHRLFEEQVERTPDVVAVMYERKSLSYAELNEKANQLARYLRQRGVGADHLVGIFVERGLEVIIGMLGILKAGAAYVPLDPAHPLERLAYMLKDADPKVLLTQEHLRERLPLTTASVIALDGDWGAIARQGTESLDATSICVSSRHLAYVIYTSGSTGQSKGVMVEHRNLVSYWRALETRFREPYGFRRMAVNSPVTFDVFVEQFVRLLSGCTLFIIPESLRLDSRLLLEFFEGNDIDDVECTPSQLTEWIAAGLMEEGRRAPRRVLMGGEAVGQRLWSALRQNRKTDVYNLYGPTECTISSTAAHLGDLSEAPHIGRPLNNTRIYILSGHRTPVPVGIAGEIYIGGAGVARGYLNKPELTAERFVKDPFSTVPEARMYKTGDLGRWRPDGTIEYLGRNDNQVKIRGFRIELGEIESHLLRHPQVKEAVVSMREDMPGKKRLVGYVVAREGACPPVEELRTHLKKVLPEYMVPVAFVALQRLPLTANGKLDSHALPEPESGAYGRCEYEAPQGEVEDVLAGIWQELLGMERVGRRDHFFELGGHSLLIVRMLERLGRVGLSASVRQVFENARLLELARTLVPGSVGQVQVPPNRIPIGCEAITPEMLPLLQLKSEEIQKIAAAVPGGSRNIRDIYPLVPLQEGMLFHHLMSERGGDLYVLPMLLSVSTQDQVQKLMRALQAMIDRHEVLRTAVLWEGLLQPVQVVYREVKLPVQEVTLDSARDVQQQVHEWMSPERQRLDLRQAPLIRVRVGKDPHAERWYVLIQQHNIVVGDHMTLEAVIAEVAAHLQGLAGSLSESVPYRNHVAQVLEYGRRGDAEDFFRRKLGDVDEPTTPFGLADVHGDGCQVQEAFEMLEDGLSQRIRRQARRLGASAATLFHAAWALVVAHTSGREDVVFGSVLLGRLQGNTGEKRIGLFINTLPLRVKLSGMSALELVESTQRELVELLGHEQASLAAAQRCSGIEGPASLFSALLNYRHSRPGTEAGLLGANGIEILAAYDRTNYPIVLTVDNLGEGFRLKAQTVIGVDAYRLTRYVRTALESLVKALEEAPQTVALSLPILPLSERAVASEWLNATHATYHGFQIAREEIESQLVRHPQAALAREGAYGAREYEAPQGEVEEILAEIWQELLSVERVGRYDNFFDLGGHSLLVMRLNERIRARFGVSLSLPTVFRHQTVHQLGELMKSSASSSSGVLCKTALNVAP